MKQEARLRFDNNDVLENIIKKSYFDNGNLGKINGKDNYFTIEETEPIYSDLKGLNDNVVKLENDLIDGIIRCLIKEEDGLIKSYPISIYCIRLDNNLYSFY